MKKTLNVNLNGRVFTIDEDAYNLLDNYLNSLRSYFRKEEGASEIITDFEARIEELFREKTRLGYEVITLENVEEVIARVGKPADFEEKDEQDEERAAASEPAKGKKRFYRNMDDKLIGGVCSGIAAYFGWNVVAIRILFIIAPFVISGFVSGPLDFNHFHGPFAFFHNFPPLLILAYIITWIVAPSAKTVEQKLQMQGKPVTVENIGKTVAAESAPVAGNRQRGCLAGFVDIFVAFLKVGVAGLGCLVGLPLLFALFIVLVVLIAVFFGVGGGLLGLGGGLIGIIPPFLVINHPVLASITGFLIIGIPVCAIIYGIIAHIAKLKPLHQSVKWGILLIWIASFILFFFSGFRIDRTNSANPGLWWQNVIVGNNIPTLKTDDLSEPFDYLEIGEYLVADIHIKQITDDSQPSIEIKGDENLVEHVRYNQYNERVVLSSNERYRTKQKVTINLKTNGLKTIKSNFIGNIRMNHAFSGDEMSITMKGVGSFYADSLYVHSLTVRTEGVGSVNLAGRSDKANLTTSGTGSIHAYDFQSDSIYATVQGVGSIRCNPTDYLEGRLKGVGSITYKDEPANKNTEMRGIGKIGRR